MRRSETGKGTRGGGSYIGSHCEWGKVVTGQKVGDLAENDQPRAELQAGRLQTPDRCFRSFVLLLPPSHPSFPLGKQFFTMS